VRPLGARAKDLLARPAFQVQEPPEVLDEREPAGVGGFRGIPVASSESVRGPDPRGLGDRERRSGEQRRDPPLTVV
jgi:hypothetical protein